MNWNHIMDCQPDHDRSIIQCEGPQPDGHYSIGMRYYYQMCTWKEFLDWSKDNDLNNPDFWWIYKEDFPFPNKDKK
jgi:hypothetical protein